MKLQVLNPVSQIVDPKKNGALAPRLSTLEGKIIGLFWNYKPGGDAALRRTEELLKARYPGLETKSYIGESGLHYLSKAQVEQITQECAAVIGSTAD